MKQIFLRIADGKILQLESHRRPIPILRDANELLDTQKTSKD